MSALVLVAPDQPVTDLAGRLANDRTVAAVVDGGQLLGLITASDLARATHGLPRPGRGLSGTTTPHGSLPDGR